MKQNTLHLDLVLKPMCLAIRLTTERPRRAETVMIGHRRRRLAEVLGFHLPIDGD